MQKPQRGKVINSTESEEYSQENHKAKIVLRRDKDIHSSQSSYPSESEEIDNKTEESDIKLALQPISNKLNFSYPTLKKM